MSPAIALVDVNNCFASAERVFQPELAGKPLVVLSSNDGCAIARSAEAKALGIKMAAPYHEFRHFEQSHGLVVRSANFSLYTNLSERIRTILETFAPSIVPYSIDESFLDLTGFEHQGLERYAGRIRRAVLQQTGMPTGIGIGTTKTLAKAAQWGTKQYPATGGVIEIVTDPARRERFLKIMPVAQIWGVGRATSTKLERAGISTAAQLANLDPAVARVQYGVRMGRTVAELRGVSALPWEDDHQVNQQIIASRSLGEKTGDRATLFASIVHHIERAARKLRCQQASAQQLSISIRTNPFSCQDRPCARTLAVMLPQPTANSSQLVTKARQLFDEIYRPGYLYAKTEIILSAIQLDAHRQADLFTGVSDKHQGNKCLMGVLDAINQRYGPGSLTVGSRHQGGNWQPRAEMRSANFTGSWDELPVAKAGQLA